MKPTRPRPKPTKKSPSVTRTWPSRTLRWSAFSALCVWLAFPPVGWWPLAWIAPIGWIRLIRANRLDGKRPYLTVYLTGCLHWMLMTHWVTLPHWSAAIGWFFLSAYLAVYVVGFVAMGRYLVHRAGYSSVAASPLSWVTLEMTRSYLFTGFPLAPLAHTQIGWLGVVQIADLTGAYGVSFVIVLAAASIDRFTLLSSGAGSRPWWAVMTTGAVLAGVLAYGAWSTTRQWSSLSSAKVAIIQGSLDTVFGGDPSRLDRAFKQYSRMTREITAAEPIDLVIWPESMFRFDIVSLADELRDDRHPFYSAYSLEEWAMLSEMSTRRRVREFGTHCLLGTSTTHYGVGTTTRYNTAAFFDADGQHAGSYHKMHPVMFGEYLPMGEIFPWLYRFTPNASGLTAGTEPKVFPAGDLGFVPNICFENTVPHLIRRQVLALHRAGETVDALVTLTNDGWFWGSSLLDFHLACGIFRAVENRKPMLIAANTGISAHISPIGQVLEKGPRRASRVIVADVRASKSVSFYTRFGDWFAGGCVFLSLIGMLAGWRARAVAGRDSLSHAERGLGSE